MNNELDILLNFLEERRSDYGCEMNELQKLINEGEECDDDYEWLQLIETKHYELHIIISYIKELQ